MTKKAIFLFAFALYFIPVFSQNWDKVKSDPTYLCGEGWGDTVEEAKQQSMSDLIRQISVTVSSEIITTDEEITKHGKTDLESYTLSKIKTYSTATLTNVSTILIESSNEGMHYGSYIKRDDINSIFESRVRTIKEFVRLGNKAEQATKIDDALRYYYWAYILLKTVRTSDDVTYKDEDETEEFYLPTHLPNMIKTIFDNLDVKMVSNDGENADLMFTYKGEPVGSLDFIYNDGRDWSNISSVKNGRGTIEFIKGLMPNNVQIIYEYEYRGQAHINQEVKAVLDVIKGNPFKGEQTNVRVIGNKEDKTVSTEVSTKTEKSKKTISPVDNEKPYRLILSAVVNAIKSKSYDMVKDCFSHDGSDMFSKLIKYGNAKILNTNELKLYKFGNDVVARSIQMSFSFSKGGRKSFVEDVVFTFDSIGKIDCIAFGLDKKATDDIMSKEVWPVETRQTIIGFLENYKTAYALKRLDYLRTIYDDNAVIIVGHVVKKLAKTGDDKPIYTEKEEVKRTLLSKEQYLRNLGKCFNSNEFINIRFANNDVCRGGVNPDEYGIQIKQDYYSTTYADEGYLYLQVDMKDSKNPRIIVRTWQPKPDPEIGIFGIEHF